MQLYQKELKDIYLQFPFLTMAGYFIIYIVVTGFSLPGAVIFTVAGGFLFGLLKGTILASFASSIGAFIAFLLSRFLLSVRVKNMKKEIPDKINQQWMPLSTLKKYFARIIIPIVFKNFKSKSLANKGTGSYQNNLPVESDGKVIPTRYKMRFEKQIKLISDKMQTEGLYYLFTLRLVPFIPFFIVNLVMGLTPIKARTFFWVSQLGMLPATLLYVNAGIQLSELETLKDIMSFPFILSFTLLGFFPLITKKVLKKYSTYRSSHYAHSVCGEN
ncbi:MAG: VTT domain-containing protein [Bdellovibrionales bacterium]|nr:VTT domain-containing protein [Bdellovibrionales bacterium]